MAKKLRGGEKTLILMLIQSAIKGRIYQLNH